MIDVRKLFGNYDCVHVAKSIDDGWEVFTTAWGPFGKRVVVKGFRLPTNAVHFANAVAKEQQKDVYWHKMDGSIRKVFRHAKNKNS